MGKTYIIALILVALLITCKKEPPKPEEPKVIDMRDNFIGRYKVISENPNFYFTINKVDSINKQWFDIRNICNSFDMIFTAHQDYVPNFFIAFPRYFPIRDKFNNRWDFGVYDSDTLMNVI